MKKSEILNRLDDIAEAIGLRAHSEYGEEGIEEMLDRIYDGILELLGQQHDSSIDEIATIRTELELLKRTIEELRRPLPTPRPSGPWHPWIIPKDPRAPWERPTPFWR